MIAKLKSLKNNQGFTKYFINTSWLMGEKVLRLIVALFIGVWVARYLGPDRFGLLSFANSFVGLFAAVATLGLDGIVIRQLVKDESNGKVLLGTSFILKLIGAGLVLFLVTVVLFFTTYDKLTNSLILIIASVTVFRSFNVIDFYFQSKVLSRYVVYAHTISLSISSVIKIVLILYNAPLLLFAWVYLFDSVVIAGGLIYFYLKTNLSFKKWRFNKDLAYSLLKDSWPLILSGIVISVYMKIDQIMIKEMLGNDAVGQYAAAVRLSEAWYFIPMVISASLFPAIINAKKASEKLYYARLQKLYDLMVWMAIAIALPMSFLSDWVVELLYGVQYNESGSVLMVHIWAGVFSFFGTARGKWLIIENLQKIGFYYLFFGGLVNISLNILLIKSIGIQGAAIATILSLFSIVLFFPLFNKSARISVYMFFNIFNIKRII